ncbi:hypothetical protein N7G274_008586 [Stereocaulon virgatum]|uniref:Uncharacterized protein n=1 Tax=Stereocaulon virgatum TaxID=373712 RepID=A0ABR4A192_9LECA
MLNGITVAWATPVGAADLGARMESYVESKATVSTFRLCVQHARIGSLLGKLPHELVEMIATQIQDALFRKRLREWEKSIECCADDCIPSDHFSRQQLQEMKRDYRIKDSDDDYDSLFEDSDDDDDDWNDYIEESLSRNGLGHKAHIDAIQK